MNYNFYFRQLEAEWDNTPIVKTILVGDAVNSRMSELELQLLHHFLSRDCKVRFRHIPKDHNEIIDHMIKIVNSNYNKKQIFIKTSISTE